MCVPFLLAHLVHLKDESIRRGVISEVAIYEHHLPKIDAVTQGKRRAHGNIHRYRKRMKISLMSTEAMIGMFKI